MRGVSVQPRRPWASAAPFVAAVIAALASSVVATQHIAGVFDNQVALGDPVVRVAGQPIYSPLAIIEWSARWSDAYPKPFAGAHLIVMLGFLAGTLIIALAARRNFTIKPFGKEAWALFGDLKLADLFALSGSVLGKFDGEIIAFDGPEHQLLIGASRSGKGRGHVVPTLLATQHSVLVLDVKGELADGDPRLGFPGTAGFRETLGPVARFAPTRSDSIRFNPMFEVPRGENEVRAVQNIIDVLFGANEDQRSADFWRRRGAGWAAAVVLHTLYFEPLERKTLAVVREKLRNLTQTAEEMRRTLHRKNSSTGQPEVHPEVLHAAESILSAEERMRSGVQATAESMFELWADPLVAANTATSDFRLSDLMCGDRPMTLYLQPPASDVQRLMPLMRTIVDLTGRTLMESQTEVGGRPKRHRLVMVLDEFPMLGRLDFFETMMGAMAGYGVKAYLVCQSPNHITRAYGRDNVIIDNCHVVTAFAATDGDSAKRIADMAGEVWEVRESETQKKPKPLFGWGSGSTTLREERRPLLLPADVRALPRDEQLIFVSGCKPIRAKKIRFDEERIFRDRLRPATGARVTLTTAHDWIDVLPLGFLEAPAKPSSKRKAPSAGQGDLFAHWGPKFSDLALAGFRTQDGERMAPLPNPQPTAPPAASSDAMPARKPRWTGV
ncbi:MAG: type IV secretory system conjugative DNA transfer family protein [Hyphomonadaceae bacterium]